MFELVYMILDQAGFHLLYLLWAPILEVCEEYALRESKDNVQWESNINI